MGVILGILHRYSKVIDTFFINLPCWFKTSAFRPKGAPGNKRSDVALLGADWGGDADPFPIFGFIPTGCFLIAYKK
jgi:hypothetical protein